MSIKLPEVYIAHPTALSAFCEELERRERFGLDTEFVGEETYHPTLCLVQVATDEKLVLIDPQTAGPLDCFWDVVARAGRTVIVHAGREEIRICRHSTDRIESRWFDLQIAAGLVGFGYPLGYGNLVSKVLGINTPKSQTRTEWRDRPLTRSQLEYAYDDVRYLLAAWAELASRLNALGRMPWADEEFANLIRAGERDSGASDMAPERWRKIKGAGALDRVGLAILRGLSSWREEAAAELNRPLRALCRDDLLIEIARRRPTRRHDLQSIRGIPRRYVDAIQEVVQHARNLPASELPARAEREIDPPQVGILATLLSAVLADVSTRRRVATGLVASNQDLRDLVREKMVSRDDAIPGTGSAGSELTRGWRCENFLPPLLAVLNNQRYVGVSSLESETPLAYHDSAEI
jgi:ribonuclease D